MSFPVLILFKCVHYRIIPNACSIIQIQNIFWHSGTDPERTLMDAFKMFDEEGKGILDEN